MRLSLFVSDRRRFLPQTEFHVLSGGIGRTRLEATLGEIRVVGGGSHRYFGGRLSEV